MIPAWLRTHLQQIGTWDTDGVHRTARPARCRKCHTKVLRGLDEDWCAVATDADPVDLTPYGELLAVVTGRGTYDLTHAAGRLTLWRRDYYNIAAVRRYPVLPQHTCGQPLPGEPLTTGPPTGTQVPDDTDPPY